MPPTTRTTLPPKESMRQLSVPFALALERSCTETTTVLDCWISLHKASATARTSSRLVLLGPPDRTPPRAFQAQCIPESRMVEAVVCPYGRARCDKAPHKAPDDGGPHPTEIRRFRDFGVFPSGSKARQLSKSCLLGPGLWSTEVGVSFTVLLSIGQIAIRYHMSVPRAP